jgi:hypothetical protein
VTLTSSTLSANQASQGGGGAIDNNGGAYTVSVGNSILAGNSCPYGPDVSNGVVSLGYNLIGQTDGSAGWVNSDLTGTSAAPLDPLLAPLGNYGGPTQTMALLAGSPALNAGDPSQLGVADQRGVLRSGGVNIGAFQASASALVFLQPPSDTAAGQTLSPVLVALVDAYGNVVVGDNSDAVTLSIGVDPSAGAATLSGTLTVTVVNGVATFGDLAIDTSGAGYTLHATIGGGVPDLDSNPFNITM